MKIAVVGSRGFPFKTQVIWWLDHHVDPEEDTIVTGGAQGVDSWAEEWARRAGAGLSRWPADWQRYGKSAGMIRNKDIVNEADKVVAFWDGESNGTKNSMELALKSHKELTVIFPGRMF